jgi:myosin-light-chain kinase
MGCCASGLQPKGKVVLMKEGGNQDFRDVYTVSTRLGSGAFGTVYECVKKKGDSTVYAVKMMEHQSSWWGRLSSSQEAQWQTFAQEFQMLKVVSHPRLVRMVGVFVDEDFVYFVMDKYETSLIQAVLPMLKKSTRGIAPELLAEVTKQMLESIAYLHSNKILHRDVKADNYLVDGTEFKGRDFKVVLTDMSTARYLEDGVFLKDIVGTREYWAPELITRSYAHQVDVWAVGVCFWCMMTAKFPFATMQDRFKKSLKKTDRMSSEQFNLVSAMLHKVYKDRVTAAAALENAWIIRECKKHKASIVGQRLSDEVVDASSSSALDDVVEGQGFGQTRQQSIESQDGDPEVDQKRFNKKMKAAAARHAQGHKSALPMDEKLEQAQKGDAKTASNQRPGESRAYEWWSMERCSSKQVPDCRTRCSRLATAVLDNSIRMESGDTVVGEPASIEWLENVFKTFNLDTSSWGKGQAKTLSHLKNEMQLHECSLLLRGDKLLRMVDLIVVRIQSKDGKTLVEASQTFSDGRERQVQRFPAVMCRAKGKGRESAKAEIIRLLQYEMNSTPDILKLDFEGDLLSELVTERTESQSYPGLDSIYRKFFFTAQVNENAKPALLNGVGLPSYSPFQTSLQDGTRVKWEWWDAHKCQQQGLPVKQLDSVLNSDFEGYRQIPGSSWQEESLIQLLNKHKVQTKLFGVGDARSLSQLVAEVNSGETQLFEKPDSPGDLRRYLEILIVRIRSSSGECLVETGHTFGGGQMRKRNLFPATKLRPFEDAIWAVRRLLAELDIPFSSAKTTFGPRRTEISNSPSYPSITTVYLKQVVEVQLEDISLENLDNNDIAAKWYHTQPAPQQPVRRASVGE